jgi:hypothetical protein
MEHRVRATDDQLIPSNVPAPEDDIVLQTPLSTASRRPALEIFEDGVTELWVPTTQDVVADLCFVHGLKGHPKKTWQYKKAPISEKREKGQKWKIFCLANGRGAGSKHQSYDETYQPDNDQTEGCYWPLDLVPKHFDNIRVLTYGYDSHPTHFYASQTTQMTISQHAQQLLQQVTNARADCRGRPIIFVAHSLGGILVNDAIVQSCKYDDQPHLQDISSSCHAICFFGTPHRGSNAARYGEILARIISAAPGSPSSYKEVLRGLKLDSEKLYLVEADSSSLLNQNIPANQKIQLYSFQEGKGVMGIKPFGSKVGCHAMFLAHH